ncbi:MAG: MBL fold metallo-hydrolase [Deltaproteobacteria bacterium]|nr:MBL fold metallo-hydrolase [Deltaproteobacteria bacterium]
MPAITLQEVDKVEIITLQDNYVDIAAMDNSAIVARAMPIKDGEIKNSILAEHGFSAVVKTTTEDNVRTMLFDFGFSEHGAAFNARTMGVPMEDVEVMALSHGHSDHFGGFRELVKMIGRDGIELVAHPAVFAYPRYLKLGEDFKIYFPRIAREEAEQAHVKIVETAEPFLLLDGNVLFLGAVKRATDFEKGFPIAHYEEDGTEKWDPIEDDTAVVMNVRGKGLVVLSGCAHSGIINTVRYAQEVTGIDTVYAVMGGFHLTGPLFEAIIERTTEELKKFNPSYVIPTHCTGRKAIMHIEKEMPEAFVLNMSGTTLTFSA